jgi:F-type H+-transporting ATPase subunit a
VVSAFAGVHLGGTATGNIWVTATMAVLTLVLMVTNGLRFGGIDYLKHFNPGPWWLFWLLIPVELIGLCAKTFALAVRLFANMMAGHILLGVLVGLILSAGTALGLAGGLGIAVLVVAGALAISLLELFVAFLQAFIFSFLTALFIGMSVNVHHEHQAAAQTHH